MGLKPIDKTRPEERRQGMWSAMRKLITFTVHDIFWAAKVEKDSVRDFLVCLENAGYVTCHRPAQRGPKNPNIYTMVRGLELYEPPRVRRDGTPVTQGNARENMWRTMRILKEFSAKDLAINASTEECMVVEIDARDYLHHLAKAGYLAVTRQGKGGVTMRYRFIQQRYSGPKAPKVQRVKAVYDPNLGRVVWTSAGGQL